MAVFLPIGQIPTVPTRVDRTLLQARPQTPATKLVPRVEGHRRRSFVTEPERLEMIRLRSLGWSYPRLSAHFDRPVSTLERYVGRVQPPEGGWAKGGYARVHDPEWIRAVWTRTGADYRATMAHCRCSRKTVYMAVSGYAERQDYIWPGRALAKIIHTVARITGIPAYDLRKNPAVTLDRGPQGKSKARAILYYLARRHLPQIRVSALGLRLGGYNHSTLVHGCRHVEAVLARQGVVLDRRAGYAARTLWALSWARTEPAPAHVEELLPADAAERQCPDAQHHRHRAGPSPGPGAALPAAGQDEPLPELDHGSRPGPADAGAAPFNTGLGPADDPVARP